MSSTALLGLTTGPLQTILTLLERWTHTRNDTAGTVFDPGTKSFVQPQVPNGTVDITVEMEAQTELARILQACPLNRRQAQSTRANDQGLLDVT